MATEAQIHANRANAQHSTGPKTEEGKAHSSKNNTRWGFRGQFAVLPSESQEEFDTLLDRLRAEHKPRCTLEDMLVLKMAQHFWLSQRAQHCVDLSMDSEEPHYDPEKLFPLFLRYQVTNDRAFHKCVDQLLKLRAQRFKEAIGFERREEQQNRERQRAEALHTRERQRAERHKLAIGLAQAKLDRQILLNNACPRLEKLQNAA